MTHNTVYTQRNLIESNRNQIVFTIFHINRKRMNTTWFRVDSIRFRKDFSVCIQNYSCCWISNVKHKQLMSLIQINRHVRQSHLIPSGALITWLGRITWSEIPGLYNSWIFVNWQFDRHSISLSLIYLNIHYMLIMTLYQPPFPKIQLILIYLSKLLILSNDRHLYGYGWIYSGRLAVLEAWFNL